MCGRAAPERTGLLDATGMSLMEGKFWRYHSRFFVDRSSSLKFCEPKKGVSSVSGMSSMEAFPVL